MVFSVFSISMVCSTSTTFSAFASQVFSAWHELVTATLSTCRCYLSVPRQRVRGHATGTRTYKYKDYIVLKGSNRSVAESSSRNWTSKSKPKASDGRSSPTCGFSLATGVAISWEIWIPYGCWMLPALFFQFVNLYMGLCCLHLFGRACGSARMSAVHIIARRREWMKTRTVQFDSTLFQDSMRMAVKLLQWVWNWTAFGLLSVLVSGSTLQLRTWWDNISIWWDQMFNPSAVFWQLINYN